MPMQWRPTLVVGVGGTGGEIAARVARTAAQRGLDEQNLLSVQCLDTDDFSSRGLPVKETEKIRFSTSQTIGQLIARNPEIEKTWSYPADQLPAEVLNMTLMNGAGMVRMFTRLALHDSFKYGRLESALRTSIDRLARVNNNPAYQGQVNVLIVGSLAGGTGCGSFLIVALALRAIAARANITRLDIRGLFLMPDVYAFGAGIPGDQVNNVRINSMAALRELNAVMQATSGNLELDSVNFEFFPGYKLERHQMPFDFVTLIDYEMKNGQNLGPNLERYKELLARTAETHLFLPVGQELDLRTVNSITDKLKGVELGTTKAFGSGGVFAVTYPEEAVLDYLTSRFARELLEGDWLVLDRSYRREVELFEERRRSGDLSVKPPDRGQSYIRDLDQYASDRRPLFVEIRQNVFREERQPDGSTRTVVAHQEFLKSFDDYIRAQFRNASDRMRSIYAQPNASVTQLAEREDLPDVVRKREAMLDDSWRDVEDAVRQVPDTIYENWWAGGLAMTAAEWQGHHVQRHLVAPAPHLVEVRYFLYHALLGIEARLRALETEALYADITTAAAAFEDNKRPVPGRRAGQGPLRQAEALADGGLVSRLFSGKRKQFSQSYVRYFNASLENVRRYGEEAALKRILERLRGDLGQLARLLELLFGDLEGLQEEIGAKLKEEERLHEASVGAVSGNRFVHASAVAKQAMWDEVSPMLRGRNAGKEANMQLLGALFSEVRKRQTAKAYRSDDRGAKPGDSFSARELFKSEVIEKFCRRTIKDDHASAFSFDVAEALRREADMLKVDLEKHATDVIQIVGRQASPFITLTTENAGSELVYWAMHPDVKQRFERMGFFDRLFRYRDEANAVEAAEYDRRQLLCVDVIFNFPITTVAKLQPLSTGRQGSYDRAYREQIRRVIDSDARRHGRIRAALSPHLDREWHKPAGLPEIIGSEDDKIRDKLYQDFVIAIGTGYLRRDKQGGDTVVAFYDPAKLEQGTRDVVMWGSEYDGLLKIFKSRPDLGMASRAGFDRELASASASLADKSLYRDVGLYKKVASDDTLAEMLRIGRNRALDKVDEEVAALTRAFFDVSKHLLSALRVDLEPGRIQEAFSSDSTKVLADALQKLSKEGVNPDTLVSIQRVAGGVLEGIKQRVDA